jgi:hypothetical protein
MGDTCRSTRRVDKKKKKKKKKLGDATTGMAMTKAKWVTSERDKDLTNKQTNKQTNQPTNQPTKMNKQSSHQRKSNAKSQQGRTPRDSLGVATPKDSQGRD